MHDVYSCCVVFLTKFCLPQELKNCCVVLDRMEADDKAAKKELEEKEDMNRRAGKAASRIPTFHKRPTGVSSNAELSGSKKDVPVQSAESGSGEPAKSRPQDGRALLPPSVRVPKVGIEAPSMFTSTEPVVTVSHGSGTPKSHGLSESFMTVTPRPSLKTQHESGYLLAELEKEETLETEAETMPDVTVSHLPSGGSFNQTPLDRIERYNIIGSAEIHPEPEVSPVEAIMDEEPPWTTEPTSVPELKDSRSSSVVEHEDDLTGEECDDENLCEMEEHQEPLESQPEPLNVAGNVDEPASTAAPEKPAKASSAKLTKVSYVVLLP